MGSELVLPGYRRSVGDGCRAGDLGRRTGHRRLRRRGGAPSGSAIVGALAGDAAIVIGLASRAVGHVSILYGYDPEEPAEKLFVLSVINAGPAVSTSAKNAAFADISRLTQALVRGKTWKVLNDSVVARIAGRCAEAIGHTLTKKGLGKVIPVAGILVGGALNWTTLEGIVDTVDMAYRRRFLLEKYPQLADEEPIEGFVVEDTDDPNDVVGDGFTDLLESGSLLCPHRRFG